jgi:hypothetical protein
MNGRLRFQFCMTLILILFISKPLLGQLGAPVPDWSRPHSSSNFSRGGVTTQDDVTNGLAFIGVTPCRIVDTRGPTGAFGGPSMVAGVPRSFPLPAGPCSGLPAAPLAYSLNITATNTKGVGYIKVYPQGAVQPKVSTLNYVANEAVANAAIVAAGTGAGITVLAGGTGCDLLIDIDGYFVGQGFDSPLNSGEDVGWEGDYAAGGLVFGSNSNPSGYGVAGYGTGIGVFGLSTGTAFNLAGVLGIDSSGATSANLENYDSAGVRGESKLNVGVYGFTQGGTAGVLGSNLDSNGNPLQYGALAFLGFGVFALGDIGATGTKSFIEPHPTDASKVIRYVCLEGPESGTYFRGTAQIVDGSAVITVPEDFRIVTDSEGLTVQLTPVGELATMAVVSEDLNQIVVKSNRDVRFHYLVNGFRKAFKDHQPIENGNEFMPRSKSETMPAYLTAEAKQRLVSNGTYNEDGTVNLATAERVGWTKIWIEREQAAKEAAAKASLERPRIQQPPQRLE